MDRDPGPTGHYLLVLALLVVGYLVSAFVAGSWASVVTLPVYVAALALAIHAARLPAPRAWGLRIALAVGSTATLLALLIAPENAVRGVAALWLALVLGATVVLVVRHVLRHQA